MFLNAPLTDESAGVFILRKPRSQQTVKESFLKAKTQKAQGARKKVPFQSTSATERKTLKKPQAKKTPCSLNEIMMFYLTINV